MMTNDPDRRNLLVSLGGLSALALVTGAGAAAAETASPAPGASRDFDFFLGSWDVHHRRLKTRLAGASDWEEFGGVTLCQSLMGGIANINDSVVERPTGTYRSLGLRAYDAKTGNWADWSLSGRDPTSIDVPGVGRFEGGVGTFLSDDSFNGRPIKVRGRFSSLNPRRAEWEQAFSADGGATWEVNWMMRYARR
jgi:hypothetical protein